MTALLSYAPLHYLPCRLITYFITNVRGGSEEFVPVVAFKKQFERNSQYVSELHGDMHTKSGHQISSCDDLFWFNKTSQLGFIHLHFT